MSISWSSVALIAPNLAASPSGLQALVLGIVDRQIDDGVWMDFADDGRLYLAAHLGTLNARGFVTSEALGAMSRSYALPIGVRGGLGLTAFGIEYQRLLRIACGPGAVVP